MLSEVTAMNEPLFSRDNYLANIQGLIGSEDVKIIMGVRRSGKSQLLKLLRNKVLEITDDSHVLYFNFEDLRYASLTASATAMHDHVLSLMKDDGRYYLFLDEIQEVAEWEKAVNSLRLKSTDIYITGSNSKIFSGQLSTYLTGRCFPISISPLSFAEFVEFRKQSGLSGLKDCLKPGYPDYEQAMKEELNAYILIGGFPLLSTHEYSQSEIKTLVEDIHSTAVLRDVVQRNNIRNVQLLDKIVSFIYDNVGSLISITSIYKYLKSQKRGAEYETIANYLTYLEEAFIIKRAQRFDVKGKKLLETNDKYYLADHSLQYAVRGVRGDRVQGVLENIVFMELVRRGYKVYVGKTDGEKEIDFVAEKDGGYVYVQVCLEFTNYESTKAREFAPLMEIKDHYPKYVVTLDPMWQVDENGVRGIHLKDFLLKKEL